MKFPLLPVRRLTGGAFVVPAPAKLNLFLEIEGRREDGYHDIRSLMLALDWGDLLVARTLPEGSEDRLTVEGETAPTDGSNLILRALTAARRVRPVPPLALQLRKRVPPGAGLGGGSSDAAALLALLESVAPDPRGGDGVREIAAGIGSDVPFFLGSSATAIASGRGDRLGPFPGTLFGGDLPGFIIAMPRIVSDTASAYARVSLPLTSPDGPITFPARTFENAGGWRRGLFNRLEDPVLASDPRLAELSRCLREFARRRSGSAEGVRMTGSGSAFFIAAGDRAEARTIMAALRSPHGPLASYTATTRVEVSLRRSHPHPKLSRPPRGTEPARRGTGPEPSR